MSSMSPAQVACLKQHAESFGDALFAMAEMNQRQNPFITDGHVIEACAKLIGALLAHQSNIPRHVKEKLALDAYTSIQDAAGLLVQPEKLNG